MPTRYVLNFCQQTGCSPEWFLTGDGEPFTRKTVAPEKPASANAEILAGQIAALEARVADLQKRLKEAFAPEDGRRILELDELKYATVPLIESPVAASENGRGKIVDAKNRGEPCILYRDTVADPETVVGIRVTGRSMEPLIKDGGIVFVDWNISGRDECRGRVVLAVTDPRRPPDEQAEWVVKRFLWRPEERCFYLVSENPEFASIKIPESWGCPVHGKVVGWWGREG